MNNTARIAVAAVLLLFAWKDSFVSITWPPPGIAAVDTPKPDRELLKWVEEVAKVTPRMLPTDRQHLAAFYDAMAFVLLRDGDRSQPIIADTDKFVAFHAGSLNLAIEKKKVGKYPGLDKAIDLTFFNAIGPESSPIDREKRNALVAACGVLSWAFGIHHE